ncbi:U32 family peptidase [Bacteroidales bacterium OttesenSCG-928-M11]|nr:U32 family peptidase [Bacteroidales bacterium OttesenSCG-928-M11]
MEESCPSSIQQLVESLCLSNKNILLKNVRKIELLAPAKDTEIGIAAIDHGADAIYIGAKGFSARSAAGNSIEDIKRLVDYAHLFHAKVYVALNTIIKNDEVAAVEDLIWSIYRANADAIIIQDMGILEMNLPPIALHASTQMDNRSVAKVHLLEQLGFAQAVLARELSLNEIREIANHTQIPLEVFVHGSLCTSYSGQCYISQALSERSANRGECAQYCRLPYNLSTSSGKILATNKHLLSLKDLNLSNHLEELLDAGVSSLKIEGRLKDLAYVKNITAYYRRRLDEVFEQRPEYCASSSGKSTPFFLPNPEKSFNRGFTSYFLHGRNREIASIHTPKSLGEPIGNIRDLGSRYFTIQGRKIINNGDGLCYINEKKELEGFRVNKVEGDKVFPVEMTRLERGITLYRNHDQIFEKELSKKSAERKITIDLVMSENVFGYTLSAIDEDFNEVAVSLELNKELAQKNQYENIRTQLGKLGNTPFVLSKLKLDFTGNWFIPSSLLGDLRRKMVDALLSVRKIKCSRFQTKKDIIYPSLGNNTLSYLANISNDASISLYKKLGVNKTEPAFEIESKKNVPLMYTKYCLRYQLGLCSQGKDNTPFFLTTGSHKLLVEFDCDICQNTITKQSFS